MNPGTYDEEAKHWVCTVPGQEWYSVQDVSIILGIGGPSVYNAIQRGSLVAYKVGGSTKVKHEDLQAYISRRGQTQQTQRTADTLIERIVPEVQETRKAEQIAREAAAEGGGSVGKIKLSLFDKPEAAEE